MKAAEIEACPFGFAVQRVDKDHLIVGLVVRGFNPTKATRKVGKAASDDIRVTRNQIRAATQALRRELKNYETDALAAQNVSLERVGASVGMDDLVKRIEKDLQDAAGQLHDYRSLALQIRQNIESYLGIESNEPVHLRSILDKAPHQLASTYWASRMVESKLDGVRLLTDPMVIIKSPHVASRLHGLVHKYRQIFDYACRDKDVSIQVMGESYGSIRGPSLAMEQIPLVLIDNAYKYAPAGSTITCTLEEDSSEITLRVASLGPKLELHERRRVFEPGYRADAAKNHEAGMGLGLALLRICCETMNATYCVDQSVEPSQTNFYNTVFSVVFEKS